MDSHIGATAHNTVDMIDNDAGTSTDFVDLSNETTGTWSGQGDIDEAAVLRLSRQ